jgi:hypothetical protein
VFVQHIVVVGVLWPQIGVAEAVCVGIGALV